MNKKRILIIGALPPPPGGMETVMKDMCSLNMKHYELIPFNVAKTKLIKSNIVFNTANFMYRCVKLIATLAHKRPELVHIHISSNIGFWQRATYAKITHLMRSPYILHMHGGEFKEFYEKSTPSKKKIIHTALNQAKAIIVLSAGWKKYFESIQKDSKYYVLPNSINMKAIEKYTLKKDKSSKFKVLFVGRVERKKGIYELLEAISKSRIPNLELDIIGPVMETKSDIDAYVKKLKIEKKVRFHGAIVSDDRLKYFSQSDVFILPSYWEAFPISILEGMAFGLPIIATAVGAIPEVVKKENGIIIPPKNVNAIVKALQDIKSNSKKISYSSNNKQKVKNNYTTQKFQKNLESIYEQLN